MKSNVFFVWALFVSAMFIAGNAAFFSIKGIALLFSGSMIPVAIMASSLEIGKLFTVSFLYRYWKTCTVSLKLYLITASIVLIAITSLGIYGFLANAFEHTRTKVDLYDTQIVQLEEDNKKIQLQIESYGQSTDTSDSKTNDALEGYERIYNEFKTSATTERDTLRTRLVTLETVIEGIKSKSSLFSNTDKKVATALATQSAERDSIKNQLETLDTSLADEYKNFLSKVESLRTGTSTDEKIYQKRIDELYTKIKSNERDIITIRQEVHNTDIGTFKFTARALNIETDEAVKWFTLAIVLVFDPLAICLIIGFNVAHVKLYGRQLDLDPNTQTIKEQYAVTRTAMKDIKRSG